MAPVGSAPMVPPAASEEPRRDADATRVLVDRDLGGDDLVALAFLLRHPSVDVEAVRIATTGLVGCEAGVRVVSGVFAALEETPVPVRCGRAEAGSVGVAFPAEWREVAAAGTGIRPVDGTPARRAAAELIGGVAEWNAAADPESFATVRAAPAPLTIVPEDAVPEGTPAALGAPVVNQVAATIEYPKWWDLATVAVLVEPDAGELHYGAWSLDGSEPGRLRHRGPGPVRVYRSLDLAQLEAAYAEAFMTS